MTFLPIGRRRWARKPAPPRAEEALPFAVVFRQTEENYLLLRVLRVSVVNTLLKRLTSKMDFGVAEWVNDKIMACNKQGTDSPGMVWIDPDKLSGMEKNRNYSVKIEKRLFKRE